VIRSALAVVLFLTGLKLLNAPNLGLAIAAPVAVVVGIGATVWPSLRWSGRPDPSLSEESGKAVS
jgi:hypothetical protein